MEYKGERFSFQKLLPIPKPMYAMIPYSVKKELFNDSKPTGGIDDSEKPPNSLDPNHWSGWCLLNWGCMSDAVDQICSDDYTLTFKCVAGVPHHCMLALARKCQLLDIHWRYQINGQQIDILLKGGGVFDITNDSFLLHPDEGELWEHQHKMNNAVTDIIDATRTEGDSDKQITFDRTASNLERTIGGRRGRLSKK
jgi:hypothetical protein